MRSIVTMLLALAAVGPADEMAARRTAWNAPETPFRVVGNVWYVGTAGLSAFLVVDPRGLVLIDGGLPESAPLIAANVARAGYRMRDVRYLLVNHSHFDHAGGLAALKRASGAKLVASRADAPDLAAGRTIAQPSLPGFAPVSVDRTVDDGGVVRVGGTVLTAHLTPGHTKGCTSWSLDTREGARRVRVLFACSLTPTGVALVRNGRETAAAGDFRRTFATLRKMRADVFLNFHAEFFGLEAKRRRLEAGDRLAFVDPGELGRQVDRAEAGFTAELARQRSTK